MASRESCPSFMQRGHRLAQLNQHARALVRIDGTTGFDQCRERHAFHPFAPEPDAAVMRIHAVDRHDVRMFHPGHHARFLQNRGLAGVLSLAGTQELERDLAVQLLVPGPVHDAEASGGNATRVYACQESDA